MIEDRGQEARHKCVVCNQQAYTTDENYVR